MYQTQVKSLEERNVALNRKQLSMYAVNLFYRLMQA